MSGPSGILALNLDKITKARDAETVILSHDVGNEYLMLYHATSKSTEVSKSPDCSRAPVGFDDTHAVHTPHIEPEPRQPPSGLLLAYG